mgnify:CR=1 FL=1
MSEPPLLAFEPIADSSSATVSLDMAARSRHRVSPLLYGKFCEHLGYNIYQGMHAQILYNATFGKIRVDEGFVRRLAERQGWPDAAPVVASYQDGAALGWFRLGEKDEVLLSPDAGPQGNQAQRFETAGRAGQSAKGIAVYTYLPLHRVRRYQFRVVARAAQPVRAELQLRSAAAPQSPIVRVPVDVGYEWDSYGGAFEVPKDGGVDDQGAFVLGIVASGSANIVLDRVLVYPADHVHGADPDIIRMLKEARLALLRWPGGNFSSGYHWRDGVGPVDGRPTGLNPVWHGIFEPNLFGTDEFVTYCRDVGCEPMICVNAGNGTPEEAASWVEYCNGSVDRPMGRLRAANGHPEPYNIRYWEIGNEIFGRHQIGWTTPAGNVDRYLRFARAMRAVDPSIRLLACGGLHLGVEAEWNRRLNSDTACSAECQTHHILEGGEVDPATLEVEEFYHACMAYPMRVAEDYRLQRQRMIEAGIAKPRLAITELQLFPMVKNTGGDGYPNPPRIPTASTISEALYATLFIHESMRLGELVEMITHTATVNHGGGLRKARERVWANPVHYAHVLGSEMIGGTPVGIRLSCGTFGTTRAYGNIPPADGVPNLDAVAAIRADGRSLILMIVHRSACAGPIRLTVDLAGWTAAGQAMVTTLSGADCADQNTLDEPRKVVPQAATTEIESGRLSVTLPPYSVTQVKIAKGRNDLVQR